MSGEPCKGYFGFFIGDGAMRGVKFARCRAAVDAFSRHPSRAFVPYFRRRITDLLRRVVKDLSAEVQAGKRSFRDAAAVVFPRSG